MNSTKNDSTNRICLCKSSFILTRRCTRVYKTYPMRILPECLLPQPHHHLGNMYQFSNHVLYNYTKSQHCDTLSAVFAHVASRQATTDSHRSTRTARTTVNMSDNRPLREARARSHRHCVAPQWACCSKISPGGDLHSNVTLGVTPGVLDTRLLV